MLAKRLVSAVVMLAGCFALVFAGGWVFIAGVALILALAGWEFGSMFKRGGYHPSVLILSLGSAAMAASARFESHELFLFLVSLLILLSVTVHILAFPKQPLTSAIDLAATLAGLVFIGFLGSFLVRLRFLPDGLYWLILAVAPAGISDIGAFFTGSMAGRHKMAAALSPHKTIEGYLGGAFTAAITGYAAGALSGLFNPAFSGLTGLLVGSVVGILCPLGDLGKSLFKRQFNLKHTSNLIPGHGGALDRIDTWLWAGVIGYYLITFFLV